MLKNMKTRLLSLLKDYQAVVEEKGDPRLVEGFKWKMVHSYRQVDLARGVS